jgi:hypothetical protein
MVNLHKTNLDEWFYGGHTISIHSKEKDLGTLVKLQNHKTHTPFGFLDQESLFMQYENLNPSCYL